MNRFNLTFKGDIVEGHDPATVRARLAQVLAIEDPLLLQRCFSGDPVVLRRNLERREAAELYARLHRLGIHAELVRVGGRGDLHAGEIAGLARPATAGSAAAQHRPAPSPAVPTPPPTEEIALPALQAVARTSTDSATAVRPSPAPPHKTSLPITRRADLAVERTLHADEAAQLADKEMALQKLLLAKDKEQQQLASARERARQQALATQARQEAKREAARKKAELAEQKRREQAAAAEREAQRERLAAEAEAKLNAALALARAEAAARQQEERERLAAARAAQREEDKRRAEAIADRLRVENARRKREQAEAAARKKAEEVRRKAQEQAAEEEQLAQRRAMEEQPIRRAAVELAHKPSLKPVEARVKTRLELPSPQRRTAEAPDRRKRQPGAPNLYSLTPFRNTPAIRARAGQSRRIMRLAFIAAAGALAAAALLVAGQLGLATATGPVGVSAIAIAPQERPLLLTDEHLLLHDRAGVSVSDLTLDSLGLAALQGPLVFNTAGALLAPALLAGTGADKGPAELLRCDLAAFRCELFSAALAGTVISALAVNPLDDSVFIADSSAGQLLKMSATGDLLARTAMALPARPVLRLDSGLLLVNAAEGPAIDIFRYDNEAFGTRLEEVLLLPPGAAADEYSGVADFLWSAGHWWVLLQQAGSDSALLYRFDAHWGFVDAPRLKPGGHPAHLASWANRTLVSDPTRIAVQRFNSDGAAESPLVSDALSALRTAQEHRANLIHLGWRSALALVVLGAVAGLCVGWLHRARGLVYTSCHEQGAEPLGDVADSASWLDLVPDRAAKLGRLGIACAVLATVLVAAGIALGISSLQLSALLLAMTGPALALLLLQRSDPGHIGVSGAQLLLVDHDGMYHLGSGSRIHYRGPFLMIDDVTVFTGTRLLPVFDPGEVNQRVMPIAIGGIKVDRKIVTVKLLQVRHPLALGAVAIAASSAGAIALLSLQGIF